MEDKEKEYLIKHHPLAYTQMLYAFGLLKYNPGDLVIYTKSGMNASGARLWYYIGVNKNGHHGFGNQKPIVTDSGLISLHGVDLNEDLRKWGCHDNDMPNFLPYDSPQGRAYLRLLPRGFISSNGEYLRIEITNDTGLDILIRGED